MAAAPAARIPSEARIVGYVHRIDRIECGDLVEDAIRGSDASDRYGQRMFLGFDGWFVIFLIYGGGLLLIGALLYLVVRLAVVHALKAHTRWVDSGKP